jgi:transmembrane sensor
VSLDDGSFVRLAPGSTLQVWDRDSERRVSLTGRAFFAVARDEERPFVVQAGASQTRVLGTRFEVSDRGGDVRTVVVDGRVAVSNGQGTVEVTGGSVAWAVLDGPPTVEMPGDVYALLDWPGGILLFQGTPLAQVAGEVGRSFDRTVEVQGDRLPSLRISGSFEGVAFEEVVLALCYAAGAVCSFTETGARIAPTG